MKEIAENVKDAKRFNPLSNENYENKGGINEPPATPRPEPPKGQGDSCEKCDKRSEFLKEEWVHDRWMERISPDVKPNEPLLWDGEKYIGLKVKRKHRLKEVQQYVQKVMNIADIKNSYEKTNDPRYKEKLEEQQKELLEWLEEEI